jgi:PPK2 family polyphosphate:nucleotide phosphotransferase
MKAARSKAKRTEPKQAKATAEKPQPTIAALWNAEDVDLKAMIKPYRVTRGQSFRLADFSTADTRDDFNFSKDEAGLVLQRGVNDLQAMQERLYADNRWSLLVIFQAMDAAGKDSTIKAVMSGINPQGCQVHAFKRPSEEELDHDFLWRTTKSMPERGRIGLFNRSYYEEVLVVRVHPTILAKQRIPEKLIDDDVFENRLKDIRRFEKFMARQGTRIVKFFLHVSPEEQKRRLIERIDDPRKNWKFEVGDLAERALWPRYMEAYEEAIRATASKQAPWYVIPADDKRFMRIAAMAALRHEMKKLDLEFPEIDDATRAKLAEARALLEKS